MKLKLITLMVLTLSLASCGGDKPKNEAPVLLATKEVKSEISDPMLNKGIGPITALHWAKLIRRWLLKEKQYSKLNVRHVIKSVKSLSVRH